MSMMDVMDPTGHTKVEWDPEIEAEVEHARETFRTMRAKGYSAFKIGPQGRQSERIDTFDPEAEAMILIPQLKGG